MWRISVCHGPTGPEHRLVGKPFQGFVDIEPKRRRGRPNQIPCNFSEQSCVVTQPHQRRSVVGNGNTDVGSKSPTHKPGQPKTPRVSSDGTKVSGAMSQQRGDSGYESAPQKFVQLV